jgi:hypothetical protein
VSVLSFSAFVYVPYNDRVEALPVYKSAALAVIAVDNVRNAKAQNLSSFIFDSNVCWKL